MKSRLRRCQIPKQAFILENIKKLILKTVSEDISKQTPNFLELFKQDISTIMQNFPRDLNNFLEVFK